MDNVDNGLLELILGFICAFIGFVGGYLFRKCKEEENE